MEEMLEIWRKHLSCIRGLDVLAIYVGVPVIVEYAELVCNLHYRKSGREGAGYAERGQVDPCVSSTITERLSLVHNISVCRLADQIENKDQLRSVSGHLLAIVPSGITNGFGIP